MSETSSTKKERQRWIGKKMQKEHDIPIAVRIMFGSVDVFSDLPKFRYPSPSDLDFSDGMASEAGKAQVVLWKIICHDDHIL